MTRARLDALNDRARTFIASERFEAAERLLVQAFDADPSFYRTRFNGGLLAASQQQWELALDEALAAADLADESERSEALRLVRTCAEEYVLGEHTLVRPEVVEFAARIMGAERRSGVKLIDSFPVPHDLLEEARRQLALANRPPPAA